MFSKLSVKKPYTVIVGILLVIVLGYISFQHMNTDLLPSMNLPYVVVYTTYVGATPEQVESEVTRPMEAAFATLTDIKEITSSSRDNVAVVIMQFNDGANMDTALIEISSALDQLKGTWSDDIGAPVTMRLNPDMLPVAIVSVSRDDMDIYELSEYVSDELVPAFEALNGVASATASGVIRKEVDVTIEQARIDTLNSAILRDVDAELADVEQQLNDAQAQLSDGKRQLARAKGTAMGKINSALNAIESGASQLDSGIEELTKQRDALSAQRDQLAQTIEGLEALNDMTDADRAALRAMQQQLAGFKQQLSDLEQQLANAEPAGEDEVLARQRADAQAQRDQLAAEREAQQKYIDDLKAMSPEDLKGEVAALERAISDDEAELSQARDALSDLTAARDGAQARVDALRERIAAQTTPAPESTGEAPITPAPETTDEAQTTDAPQATGEATATDGVDAARDDEATDGPADTPGSDADADNGAEVDSGSTADGEGDLSAARRAPRMLALIPAALADAQGSLSEQLSDAERELDQAQAALDAKRGEADALERRLSAHRTELEEKKEALSAAEGDPEDVQSRIAAAQRQIDALDVRIAALDVELAGIDALIANSGDNLTENLRQRIAEVNQQIADVEGSEVYQALSMAANDPDALREQYVQAQAGLAQMDAGLAQMDATLEKLKQGVIPAGFIEGVDEDTNLADAKSKLLSARSMAASAFADAEAQLADGEAELAKARAEFYEKRDEALENAGLDGVITVEMVSGLIGAQNFSMPAGYVRDLDNDQVLVRVGDKFTSLEDMKRMKLFSLGLDSIDEVRLADVASVAITDDSADVFTKLNGSDGILLSFDKQSTYSTADVADTIMSRARTLMEEVPGLHIVDLMNQGEYIDIIVDSVLSNLASGGALAILILLLFLMDFRPTITVAFSIPISVVIAFVAMYFTGITLNVLSLSGLSLGIGMLVDNSIVAIENIYRLHDEEGVPLLRACVEGVRSVSGALFSSTLTTICVFLPIVFVQGMARDLFADMGLTIAYSLLASLLVAMTVVPMMCSFLMRKSRPKKHRVFSRIQAGYTALLKGALRVKPLVLLAALGLLVFAGMQVPKMGISFMPEVNSRQMSATLTPDPEASTAEQRQLALDIMDDMLAIEGVDSVGLMGGSGGMLAGLGGGQGSMSYYIIVDESAGRKNADIAAEMSALAVRHDADLSVQASTMDISMLTGSGISVEITGSDLDVMQDIARDVAELARQTEGTVDVSDGLEEAVPEMRIVVDKEKAIDEGLTTAQVFQFLAQKLMGSIEISKVTLDGKELSVYLIDGKNRELKPDDLEDLEIEVNKEGDSRMVRIGDIAEVRETTALSTINRSSQRRMVSVSFGIADGYSANLVSDDFEARLKEYKLPAGYNAELAGENETVMGIMEDLVWMVLIAILLIFLIMVAQFQSFKSPIIVMFTIPLAFTGGLLALLLTGMDLSIVSMLGFLVLSGVVVNNGIVFIDCVNQLRIGGMEKRDALVEAGRQRLRPILMTALTTILGMSTMALGQGTGAEMMQPMAVVSIGGLSYATLMTLFVVPVLYDLLNGKKMKAREIQMIREAAGMNGDEVLSGDSVTDALTGSAASAAAQAAAEADTPVPAMTSAPTANVPAASASPAPTWAVEPEPTAPAAPRSGAIPAAQTSPKQATDAEGEIKPVAPNTELPEMPVLRRPHRPRRRSDSPITVRLTPGGKGK